MIQKQIAIVRIPLSGSPLPAIRCQLAHQQLVEDHHRDNAEDYALDQFKWVSDSQYFVIVLDRDIPKVTRRILTDVTFSFKEDNTTYTMRAEGVEYFNASDCIVGISPQLRFYSLSFWCPFDADEHWLFREILQGDRFDIKTSIPEQRLMLEDQLRNHLFSFARKFHLTSSVYDISCAFIKLRRSTNRTIFHFNQESGKVEAFPRWSFTGEFVTNMILPDWIGLGKGIRYGNGVVRAI